jgi:hypothetical protein
MAARLGIGRANVARGQGTSEATTDKDVQVIVSNNVATLRRGRDTIATMTGVTAVEKISRTTWKITGPVTEAGVTEVWEATRSGGCGCGRKS